VSAASTASTIFAGENSRGLLRQLGARRSERRLRGRALGEPLRIARAPHGRAERHELLRIRETFGERVVAARDAIDEAERARFFRACVAPGQHQVERGLRADQARRALRAARAGQQAERDFGQPELRAGQREPVMRGERDLEAAAERRAVQRDHHRLRARLDPLAHVGQRRRHGRLAEFADVGARDEVAAGADDQHRADCVIGLRGVERIGQAAPHVGGQRVDGRMVDRDDEQRVAALVRDAPARAGAGKRLNSSCLRFGARGVPERFPGPDGGAGSRDGHRVHAVHAAQRKRSAATAGHHWILD
jgi:hypothetical protein